MIHVSELVLDIVQRLTMGKTSGESAFSASTGWPAGEIADTGLFETEKEFADSFPIRKTDVSVIEHAKATEVTSFIVIPPMVCECSLQSNGVATLETDRLSLDGKGSGQWNQLSVLLPVYVQGCISSKAVHKFANDLVSEQSPKVPE